MIRCLRSRSAGSLARSRSSAATSAATHEPDSVLHELSEHKVLNQYTALDESGECQVSNALRSSRSSLASSSSLPGVYVGIDPTAPSLHVGNLLQLCTLLRFKRRGFPTYCVIGGGTGLIGDPSGRATERALVENARALENNITEIGRIVSRVMGDHAAHANLSFDASSAALIASGRAADTPATRIVDNASWLGKLSALDFLRDVGKHFSVSNMLSKDSVKSRLHSSDGITYTEFSYQLLQAYDFFILHREHDVCIQLGGSDQWGNIVAGTEFVRRAAAAQRNVSPQRRVVGVTLPLLLTSDGVKIGKSSGNAPVWLSAHLTSPFEFYQHFVQLSDSDALRLLPQLTLLDLASIAEIVARHNAQPERTHAQRALARALTLLVHGERAADAALRATSLFFGATSSPSRDALASVVDALQPVIVSRAGFLHLDLSALLVEIGASTSRTMARKLIESGGVSLNEQRIRTPHYVPVADDLLDGAVCLLRVGKRHPMVVRVQ